jgi:methylmalonyl-CoA epimerase
VIRKIHHIGIAVQSLSRSYAFYRDALGLPLVREAEVKEQGVRAALLGAGESEIELLEPLSAEAGVARFLARRGEGLHHLCLEAEDVGKALEGLSGRGVSLIDRSPRPGLAGMVAFLRPKACAGVLVELATPTEPHSEPASPARLKRLVIGARDPSGAARTFSELFDLTEEMPNEGPRAMLRVGSASLLMVPAEEVGGSEGLVALSLLAGDFPALVERLEGARISMLRGAGEVTVEPASSYGVHLHISRFD